MKQIILIALTSLAIALPGLGDPFRNLGFEEVNPASIPNAQATQQGLVTDLLPGWQVFNGNTQLTTIGYNYFPGLPSPGYLTIFDSHSPAPVISGNFGLAILENFQNSPPISIQQRGDIPSFAQRMFVTYSGLPLSLLIDGQQVFPVASFLGPSTQEFDLTPFTGRQDVLLSISLSPSPTGNQTGVVFDNLVFAVPEPRTAGLLVLGAVGLAWQMCRQHAS